MSNSTPSVKSADIVLKATIEQLDLEQIKACIQENLLLSDEFKQMRKTVHNIYRFVTRHNLGYLDNHTNEFLSHDREYCFFRLYF